MSLTPDTIVMQVTRVEEAKVSLREIGSLFDSAPLRMSWKYESDTHIGDDVGDLYAVTVTPLRTQAGI